MVMAARDRVMNRKMVATTPQLCKHILIKAIAMPLELQVG
jgi:hypothetical protein